MTFKLNFSIFVYFLNAWLGLMHKELTFFYFSFYNPKCNWNSRQDNINFRGWRPKTYFQIKFPSFPYFIQYLRQKIKFSSLNATQPTRSTYLFWGYVPHNNLSNLMFTNIIKITQKTSNNELEIWELWWMLRNLLKFPKYFWNHPTESLKKA